MSRCPANSCAGSLGSPEITPRAWGASDEDGGAVKKKRPQPARGRCSTEAALDRSINDLIGARIFLARLAHLPVANSAQAVRIGLHPLHQLFGGLGGNIPAR